MFETARYFAYNKHKLRFYCHKYSYRLHFMNTHLVITDSIATLLYIIYIYIYNIQYIYIYNIQYIYIYYISFCVCKTCTHLQSYSSIVLLVQLYSLLLHRPKPSEDLRFRAWWNGIAGSSHGSLEALLKMSQRF